jgi:integrase
MRSTGSPSDLAGQVPERPTWGTADLELPPVTAARIDAAVPANTRRNWASRWRPFALWCLLHERTALPATAETLAAYLDARTRDFIVPVHLQRLVGRETYQALTPSSLAAHLGTLRAAHRVHGHPSPDPFLATQVIKARARELAADPHHDHAVRQATPLRGRDLARLLDAIDTTTPSGLRDRALLLLAYKSGRRGAELAHLNLTDVREAPDPADPTGPVLGVRVTFRTSKTNPHGLRRDDTIKIKRVGGDYCPVAALRAWRLYLAGRGYTSGPLFPRIDRHGNLGVRAGGRQGPGDDGRITPKTVHAVVNSHAQAAGLVPLGGYREGPDGLPVAVRITAHSTRRGYVTDAFTRPDPDAEKIGRQAGFAPGSRTLYRYRDVDLGWDDDPTEGLIES